MPQFGGITTHSSRAAKFVDTVTKHLIKAGKAFNRKVHQHKAKKSIGKPSKASKRITKSVHKRSISKASPQRHIPSPARPVVTNRPPASVPRQPVQPHSTGQPFNQNHTPVAQPSPRPPSGQPVHQNPSPASPVAPAAPSWPSCPTTPEYRSRGSPVRKPPIPIYRCPGTSILTVRAPSGYF